ncbi:MAG: helix-turn-helix domain-containing protein [Erysipelotrichales bacterium]|nr:helix-turn-helix domain-containing protein [Erysipelotrichales bacterium]
MNLEKIGKFISERRKDKSLTQEQLAEKLGISDRAISKWERGLCLPDASIMIPLCEILGINVNELLSGEMISNKDYDKKAEENLYEMALREEQANKKMMMYEIVIGLMSTITFLTIIFVSAYLIENTTAQIILFVLAFVLFITGISFALKIETETGYYECDKCHHKYVPKYSSVYFAMHFGTTRYLKCPKCHERSWNKKTMK